MVRTAKEITADDLSLRIDSENRKDEIGLLVETLNDMIARLEKSVKIDNAIRYTPSEGCVEINLEKNDKFALLNIRDTGIGIPEESLPFIFDRFYVVDKSPCKESGGSGLGLSIAKSVADSHGAVIDVKSVINQGTTFQIKFPLS